MEMFKSLDIRGLSFYKAFDLTSKEFSKVKMNGILELILDKKKNFTEDFTKWAKNQGCRISDIKDDPRMVRLYIHKGCRVVKA
jgi:TusA-related sulfurtransferase